MQKKVLIFNGFYPNVRGGAEMQAKVIAEECMTKGFEVVFISVEDQEDEIAHRDNFKVHVISNPNDQFNNLTLYYFFMQRMLKIIDAEQPSLIYQRILNSFSPYLAKYAAKKALPFVLHIANTHCFSFSNSLRDKVRLYLFNRLKKYPVEYIAQTKEQESLLAENGLSSSLSLPNFYRTKTNIKNVDGKSLKVLWVANIRPVKQVELFFQLAKSLKEMPLQFVVIGRIEEESKRSQYIKEMGSIPNLEYAGECSMQEVDDYMEKAFVLVNTSRSEGFSNTFIQAWAKGTPVVSLHSDPNSYLIEKKVGIFANGDLALLKTALVSYVEDPALYQAHSIHSNELYQEELSFEKNSDKLIEFFENNWED